MEPALSPSVAGPVRAAAPRRARRRLVAMAVVLSAAFPSCADDPPSLGDWQEEADAVCGRYEEQLAALGPFPEESGDVEERLQALRRIVAAQVDELRSIEPPDVRRVEIGALLDDLEEIVDNLEAAVAASRSGDDSGVAAALEDAAAARAAANESAADLALEVCGQQGGDGAVGGPVAQALYDALVQDLTEEEARCVTDEVLAAVPEEELLALEAGPLEALPPELQEAIFGAATRCISPRRLAELRE